MQTASTRPLSKDNPQREEDNLLFEGRRTPATIRPVIGDSIQKNARSILR